MYCARCKRPISSVTWINDRPYGPTCATYVPGHIGPEKAISSQRGSKSNCASAKIRIGVQHAKTTEDPDQMGLFGSEE